MTDTDGRLLAAEVHAAHISEPRRREGRAEMIVANGPFACRDMDGGYAGRLVERATDQTHVNIEIVRRMPRMKGFTIVRRRWVVERTFAWAMRRRRLARDWERLTRVTETLVMIAASATLVRRRP